METVEEIFDRVTKEQKAILDSCTNKEDAAKKLIEYYSKDFPPDTNIMLTLELQGVLKAIKKCVNARFKND